MEIELLDSNGYPKLNRFKIIKDSLEEKLNSVQEKYDQDFMEQLEKKNKRPIRKTINTVQVKTMLFRACTNMGFVDNTVAQSLTEEQLMNVYLDFLDLIEWLQNYCVFAPSRQIFCSFAGIADSNYNWLLQYGSAEQRKVMDMVNNYIIDLSLEQAQQGNAKENTTKFRMKAKSVGHGIVEASSVDKLIEQAEEQYDEYYYRTLLSNILPKQIDNKEK